MADKISENLIDEILHDVKTYTGEGASEPVYSASAIDSLIADIMGSDYVAEAEVVTEAYSSSETKVVENNLRSETKMISFDVPKIQSLADENMEASSQENTEAPVLIGNSGQYGFTSDVPEDFGEEER